jgi:hypothetical protein
MLGPANAGAGHEDEASGPAEAHHVVERLYPIRVVFHRLAGNHLIVGVVGPSKVLSLANDVDSKAWSHVYSGVVASAENISNRAVDIQRANL